MRRLQGGFLAVGVLIGCASARDEGTQAVDPAFQDASTDGPLDAGRDTSTTEDAADAEAPEVSDAATCLATTPFLCPNPGLYRCAPDWSTALALFPHCEPQTGNEITYLARCGAYDAVVSSYVDVYSVVYYGDAGDRLGQESWSFFGGVGCESYDPSFTLPEPGSCVALEGTCLADGAVVPDGG